MTQFSEDIADRHHGQRVWLVEERQFLHHRSEHPELRLEETLVESESRGCELYNWRRDGNYGRRDLAFLFANLSRYIRNGSRDFNYKP